MKVNSIRERPPEKDRDVHGLQIGMERIKPLFVIDGREQIREQRSSLKLRNIKGSKLELTIKRKIPGLIRSLKDGEDSEREEEDSEREEEEHSEQEEEEDLEQEDEDSLPEPVEQDNKEEEEHQQRPLFASETPRSSGRL